MLTLMNEAGSSVIILFRASDNDVRCVAYIAGDCMEMNKTTTDKLISYYSFFGFLVESLELKEESLYS
jgi:hypothetical protein